MSAPKPNGWWYTRLCESYFIAYAVAAGIFILGLLFGWFAVH